MKNSTRITVTARIPKTLWVSLKKFSKDQKRSIGAALECLIEEAVKKELVEKD